MLSQQPSAFPLCHLEPPTTNLTSTPEEYGVYLQQKSSIQKPPDTAPLLTPFQQYHPNRTRHSQGRRILPADSIPLIKPFSQHSPHPFAGGAVTEPITAYAILGLGYHLNIIAEECASYTVAKYTTSQSKYSPGLVLHASLATSPVGVSTRTAGAMGCGFRPCGQKPWCVLVHKVGSAR